MNAPRQVKLEAKAVRLAFYNERIRRQLPVLGGIDLRVHEGELVAIVGPSGCGKSTFLGAVDGLVKITGGEIAVNGKPVGKNTSMELPHRGTISLAGVLDLKWESA